MEENMNGELTFKMIWQRIKQSAVRILVYAIIALIIGAGVMGITDIVLSKSQFETKITYYYEGVEEGKDPWGGQMDFVNGIKSPSNVSTALEQCKYTEEEIKELTDLVINNLTVAVDMSDEKKDKDDIITSAQYNFRIILTQNSDMDKLINSKNDYTNIVSAITNNYLKVFKSRYSYNTSLVGLTASDAKNFIAKYNTIKDNLNQFLTEIQTLNDIAPNYVSSQENYTFGLLMTKASAIANELENFKSYILSNSITTSNEQQQIKITIEKYYGQMRAKEKEIKNLQTALETIASMPSTGTGTGTGSIIITSPDYKELQAKLTAAIEENSDYEALFNEWVDYGKYYGITVTYSGDTSSDLQIQVSETEPTDPEVINKASEQEQEILAIYNALIDDYKSVIDDYNQSYNVQSLVRITSQAMRTKDTPVTLLVFLIIEAVLLVLAVIIAMSVTAKKGEMILRKKLKVGVKKDEDKPIAKEDK